METTIKQAIAQLANSENVMEWWVNDIGEVYGIDEKGVPVTQKLGPFTLETAYEIAYQLSENA